MSVQAGMWSFDGQPIERDCLYKISIATAAHGPDGEQFRFNGNIGFLYRPFHTTEESRREKQPYVSVDGTVITWDGRLDNRDQLIPLLAQELRGEDTDVAIIAAALRVWGKGSLSKIRGEWALAVWDPENQELILSRDYLGVRHLFYRVTPTFVVWCNDLTALALAGDQLSLCNEWVAGCLASLPDADLTPYREIRSVPPAKFVRIRTSELSIHGYWSFHDLKRTSFKTDAEYEQRYRVLFRQAVRRRLRTGSPVLADLSGGFDSSSIVCIADKILSEQSIQVRLDTFSFYDSGDPPEEADLPYLKAVEKQRGTRGLHIDLAGSTEAFGFECSEFVPTPRFGNRPDLKAALLSAIRTHPYRVLISGEGGDEVNGQASDPRVYLAELLVNGRLHKLGKELTAWSLLIRKTPWIQLLLQTLLQLAPSDVRAKFTKIGKVEPWVKHGFASKYRMSVRQVGVAEGLHLARPAVRDAATTLAGLARLMSCSGQSTIEKRYPYLDQDLVEFLFGIPLDQLLRPGERRSLMRRALVNVLPAEILNRTSKATFGSAFLRSLEKHWNDIERIFECPLTGKFGYIEPQKINAAIIAMRHGQCPPFMTRLLNAICLEIWVRDVASRGVIAEPFSQGGVPTNGAPLCAEAFASEK